MGIVTSIANFFRSNKNVSGTKPDKFKIIEPLMASREMIQGADRLAQFYADNTGLTKIIRVHPKPGAPRGAVAAFEAYQKFVKALGPHEQAVEKQRPYSSVLSALTVVEGNLQLIEDNFNALFGEALTNSESSIRTSALFVIGYIESAQRLATWANNLAMGAVDLDNELTPHQINELILNAPESAKFVSDNLNKWNPRYKGLITYLRKMQQRGTDVLVNSSGKWLDELVDDKQFTDTELVLMSSALRNPILMNLTGQIHAYQEEIRGIESKRDWLISKIAFEEAKLNGLEESNPDYARMRKAVDYYAARVSHYEQQLERMRS